MLNRRGPLHPDWLGRCAGAPRPAPRPAQPVSRRAFLALGGAAAAAAAASLRASQQSRAYSLEPIAAGHTLKDAEGRVVLSYLTSKPEGVPLAGNSVCCIHPFNTLGGVAATDIAPADHRDHRGIFFAWHDMTFTKNVAQGAERGGGPPRSDRASRGAGGPDDQVTTVKGDFWGWGRFAPIENRVIRNTGVRLTETSEAAGTVTVANDWTIGPDVVMKEESTIRAAEEQGARVLDLTYRFSSDYDVTLNQMAFTGFCFRARKEGPYTFFDSNGEVTLPNSGATNPATDWPAKPWYSHQVTLPDGKIVSSAVIDHPSNPPSLWHGARSVSFLNPCISAPGPVTIPARRPLTLRYRAVAHDGKFPDGWLDRTAAAWRNR